MIFCMAGNFGEVLIWQFGEFGIDCQIKNSPVTIELNACIPMAVSVQIAKNLNFANSHFAKFNARQSYPLCGSLLP